MRQISLTFLLFFTGYSAISAKEQVQKTTLTPREIFQKTSSVWSGEIFLLPKRGNYMLNTKEFDSKSWMPSTIKGQKIPPHPLTMHGVAWDYDLRIPLVFFDPKNQWLKSGQFDRLAVQQDIAPTIAALLGIPSPAKNGGRVLTEAFQSKMSKSKPKAILIFVQDQVGRQYLSAHPGKAKFYESLMEKGANFRNGSVAHVDVETSVGHAAVGTGSWPREHGVSGNNLFHNGIFRQVAALGIRLGPSSSSEIYNPNFYFIPTLSDIWSVARANKPVILSVAPAPRASIAMGGHGALFNGGSKSFVTWLDEDGDDGQWITEEDNYRLPESFKEKPILPWVKALADQNGEWHGHTILTKTGGIKMKIARSSPALIRQQTELTLNAIAELNIGRDDETDLVWLNTKSTDYCGHIFGFESDECGDVLTEADEAAKKAFDLIDRQTDGNFLVVLTADHGAAPMPELTGAYRLDRGKLKDDLNHKFDKNDNNIDAIQAVTSSQIYVNTSELAINGVLLKDVISYLKQYKVKMEAPYNALADEWVRRGKAREALFFEDVVAK